MSALNFSKNAICPEIVNSTMNYIIWCCLYSEEKQKMQCGSMVNGSNIPFSDIWNDLEYMTKKILI